MTGSCRTYDLESILLSVETDRKLPTLSERRPPMPCAWRSRACAEPARAAVRSCGCCRAAPVVAAPRDLGRQLVHRRSRPVHVACRKAGRSRRTDRWRALMPARRRGRSRTVVARAARVRGRTRGQLPPCGWAVVNGVVATLNAVRRPKATWRRCRSRRPHRRGTARLATEVMHA